MFPAPLTLPPSADCSDGFGFVSEGGEARAGPIPMMGIGEGDVGADVVNLNPISDKELLTIQQDWRKRKKKI